MIKLTKTKEQKPDPKWTEVKGKIKARWSKLNDEEIEAVKNNIDLLSVQLVRRYGFSDDFAKHESETFIYSLTSKNDNQQIEIIHPNIHEMNNSPKVGEWYG